MDSKNLHLGRELKRFRKSVIKDLERSGIEHKHQGSQKISEHHHSSEGLLNRYESSMPEGSSATNFRRHGETERENALRLMREHLASHVREWLLGQGGDGTRRLDTVLEIYGEEEPLAPRFWDTPQGERARLTWVAPSVKHPGKSAVVMVDPEKITKFEEWFARTTGLGQPLPASEISRPALAAARGIDLKTAVTEALTSGLKPGRGGVRWTVFNKLIWARCGKEATDWGFSPKSIERMVRKIPSD